MYPATAAQGDAPDVAGKPGEYDGRPADHKAPGGLMETSQRKNDSGRIKKGMGMGTAYLDLLVLPGHYPAAGPATNGLHRCDNPLLLPLAGGPMLWSVSTIDPQENRLVICRPHGSRQQWLQSLPEWYVVPAEHRP